MNRIGVIYNPIAGRGRGGAAAKDLIGPLKRAGYLPILQPAIDLKTEADRAQFLAGIDCLVIVGGDGTVRYNIESASRAKVPVWNLPAGNECLFARHFAMKAGAGPLIDALKSGRTEQHYFGRVNGTPFFLMVSAGLDAAVIHRLHQGRSGGVNWTNYVMPTLIEMSRYRSPEISVRVDGKIEIERQRGLVIVSNSKEYAWRIDPVREADSSIDLLHGRFFPDDGFGFYLHRLIAAMRKKETQLPGEKRFDGREIVIDSLSRGVKVQADGEPAGELPARLTLAEERLIVLQK